MNTEDQMQQNIRRTTGLHALKKIRAIVDKENENDAATGRTLRWLLRYGCVVGCYCAAGAFNGSVLIGWYPAHHA